MPPAAMPGPKPKNTTASAVATRAAPPSHRRKRMSVHCLEFVDHPLDHREALRPEVRIARVEAEGGEKCLVMLTAPGLEHLEILVLKARQPALIGRVERIHEPVPEGIGIDVEGRMHEMRDIGPE